MKPVLLVFLLSLACLEATTATSPAAAAHMEEEMEGSGDTLIDLDLDDDDEDDALGSGDGDDDQQRGQDSGLLEPVYDVYLSSRDGQSEDMEYYDDLYPEDYEELLDNYDEDEEDFWEDEEDEAEDSVLKIVDEIDHAFGDIEIKVKPSVTGTEEEGLEEEEARSEQIIKTSQIFIMVGSAFVSFAIFMISFFMCRRMVARREEKKRIPFTVQAERRVLKESSIVKDYAKVPTTTNEFLQNSASNGGANDKYGGDDLKKEPAAAAPLV